MAFGMDDDFEIEYVPKESAVPDNNSQPREVIIDSVESRGLTRQEAIKNEINDLAKESPESVAAIIKSMFRGEN